MPNKSPTTKGMLSTLSWPNPLEAEIDPILLSKRRGQKTIDAWAAERRAFLSSCIEDAKQSLENYTALIWQGSNSKQNKKG